MDMLTEDSRRRDQFDRLGLYGVLQRGKPKQTRKPGNIAAKNGFKATIVVDRNGTPLLSVGGKHERKNRRARSEARAWASPSSSPRNKQARQKKRRPASASIRSSSHLQKALAVVEQIHSRKNRHRKIYNPPPQKVKKRRPQSAPQYKRGRKANRPVKYGSITQSRSAEMHFASEFQQNQGRTHESSPTNKIIESKLQMAQETYKKNGFAKIATRKRNYVLKAPPTLIERLAKRNSSMQVHRKRPSSAVVPKRKAKASLKRPKSALPRMSDQGSIHIPNPQLEKYDDEQKKAVKVLQFYIRVYLGRKRRKKAEEEKRKRKLRKMGLAETRVLRMKRDMKKRLKNVEKTAKELRLLKEKIRLLQTEKYDQEQKIKSYRKELKNIRRSMESDDDYKLRLRKEKLEAIALEKEELNLRSILQKQIIKNELAKEKVNNQRRGYMAETRKNKMLKAELESLKQLNICTGKRTSELEKQIENDKKEHNAFRLVCKKKMEEYEEDFRQIKANIEMLHSASKRRSKSGLHEASRSSKSSLHYDAKKGRKDTKKATGDENFITDILAPAKMSDDDLRESRNKAKARIARLKNDALREEWKAKLLKSETDQKMQRFKTFSEAFQILSEKTGVKTIEEMKARFEKIEERNIAEFERVRALMIEEVEIMENIEAKRAELHILKTRNAEAEAPRKRIIDRITAEVEAIKSQTEEIRLQKNKMLEKAQHFRHGLYRLFESIGYEINDPGYKNAQNHIRSVGAGKEEPLDKPVDPDQHINEGEAIALSSTNKDVGDDSKNEKEETIDEFGDESRRHSSVVSRHRLSAIIAAERNIYQKGKEGANKIDFEAIDGVELVRLLDNIISSLHKQIQEAEHMVKEKRNRTKEKILKELDADSEKGARSEALEQRSNTTAKKPKQKLESKKDKQKDVLQKDAQNAVSSSTIDFKNIIPPAETLKSVGPFVDTGTLFHKLPEKALEMAYFNVASKFPRQSLDMQGMPINISEQREALMAGLKDQLKRDQQSRTMLTKIMNKTQGLS